MSATTYFPELYDAFNRDNKDVEWYRDHATSVGGPVLELGCGTGRTLLPIARAGVDIDGLDLSRDMLDALERKLADEDASVRGRVRVYEQDMATFSVDRRYRVVQIPFRTFLHNTTHATQLSCLRACFAALEPGGELVLNVFFPSLEYMASSVGSFENLWRMTSSRRGADGSLTLFHEWSSYDAGHQIVTSYHRFETFDARGTLKTTRLQQLELAYLFPGDLRALLFESGFADHELSADFNDELLVRDDQEIIVVARRP